MKQIIKFFNVQRTKDFGSLAEGVEHIHEYIHALTSGCQSLKIKRFFIRRNGERYKEIAAANF